MVPSQKLLEGVILKLPERTQSTANNEATQESREWCKIFIEDNGFQARWSNRGKTYPPMLNI